MAAFVYILCAVTCGVCAALLLRKGQPRRHNLLFWSGAAFVSFTLANVIVFIDLVVVPDIDLMIWRNLLTLAGIALLLFGLIWEGD
jgi:hypothetical protein